MTAINSNRAIRGPVTAVPVVAGKGVRLVADTENNRWVVEADETLLWDGDTGQIVGSTSNSISLSESAFNFEKIAIYAQSSVSYGSDYEIAYFVMSANPTQFGLLVSQCNSNQTIYTDGCTISVSGATLSYSYGFRTEIKTGLAHRTDRGLKIVKVVGINRVASN